MDPTDILHAARHPDPYPWYRALRERPEALLHDPALQLWIAARPETVRAALADPRLTVRPAHEPVPAALVGTPAGDWFGRLVRMNEGPAAHAVPRAALQQGLAQVGPDAVEAAVRCAVAGGLGGADWTWRVPVKAVAALLGFGADRLGAVADWTEALAGAVGGRTAAAPASAAVRDLLAALGDQLDGAAANSLVGAVRQAEGASRDAKLANLAGLLSQTCDATAGLLGNAVVALARGADAGDLEALVDGVLREDPPIHHTRRFARETCELAGTALPAGATVVVVLVGADRPFGDGRHACPGEILARRISVAALQARRADPAPWPRRWRYRDTANARIPQFEP